MLGFVCNPFTRQALCLNSNAEGCNQYKQCKSGKSTPPYTPERGTIGKVVAGEPTGESFLLGPPDDWEDWDTKSSSQTLGSKVIRPILRRAGQLVPPKRHSKKWK